jgi:transcriptional regulator with PAS, ATPase and Fis domain
VAEGGTVFLDEIGDISPAMQIRLLRVLQERIYEPLGSVEPVTADVRIITATHRDLEDLVRRGSFREDLYYRINVFQIDLPPLSHRREDIPLLIDHFINRFNTLQRKEVAGITDGAMNVLMRYDFPGNARELENAVEHAFVLCQDGVIDREHLPKEILENAGLSVLGVRPGVTLRSLEALHIADALRRHDGNRSATAAELGIHPTTLRRKIRDLEIIVPDHDGRRRR